MTPMEIWTLSYAGAAALYCHVSFEFAADDIRQADRQMERAEPSSPRARLFTLTASMFIMALLWPLWIIQDLLFFLSGGDE